MKYKSIIIGLILIIGVTSCSENLPYVGGDSDGKLVFICNLEAGKSPSAMLITSTDITGQVDPTYPEDGNISITRIPKDSALKFEFIEDGYYVMGQGDYFQSGEYYNITGFLDSNTRNVITTLSPVKIVNEVPSGEVQVLNNKLKDSENPYLDIIIYFPQSLEAGNHNLQFDVELFSKYVDENTGVETINSDPHAVSFIDFFELVPYFHILNHKPGVLLNTSQLQANQVTLRVNLQDNGFDQNEFLNEVKVKVITLSNENYNFNLYISKLADTDVSSPVTLYTNIKNGYGVLSSSFTKEVVVKVN